LEAQKRKRLELEAKETGLEVSDPDEEKKLPLAKAVENFLKDIETFRKLCLLLKDRLNVVVRARTTTRIDTLCNCFVSAKCGLSGWRLATSHGKRVGFPAGSRWSAAGRYLDVLRIRTLTRWGARYPEKKARRKCKHAMRTQFEKKSEASQARLPEK
jgi:hypothetical protein